MPHRDSKELFESSAIPASAIYHAKKAANNPNMPPAFWHATFGTPSGVLGVRKYEMASRRKVIQTQKKSREKTTVERSVRSQRRKVKMNQPFCDSLV